ncbi:MAG: S-layer homology domain-containing protein [bacterium]
MESSLFYSMGAATFTLGPGAGISDKDPLGFLQNPAMFTFADKKQYIFSLIDSGGDYPFKHTGFAMITPHKNALSFFRARETATFSHDALTYTLVSDKILPGKYSGVNITAFRFKEPTGDEGTGIKFDIGIAFPRRNRTAYGIAFLNLISSNSSVGTQNLTVNEEIPSILNLTASYDWDDNTVVHIGHQKTVFSKKGDFSKDFSRWGIGVEYSLPQIYTVRTGLSSSDMGTQYNDKAATIGGSFAAENIEIDAAGMFKNDTLTNPMALTVAYTPKEKVKEPPPVVEEEEEKFEEPLPAIPIEEEKKVVEPVAEPEAVEEERPLRVLENFTVEPEAIFAGIPLRAGYTDLEGHWDKNAVADLAAAGYFPQETADQFRPSDIVERAEFYRLLFTTQLEGLFGKSLEIKMFAPVSGAISVEMTEPSSSDSIKLLSRTIDEPGWQAFEITQQMIAEKAAPPSKYTVACTLESNVGDRFTGEDSVIVLDAAVDFGRITSLDTEKREAEIQEMKKRLGALGMSLDYLDNLKVSGAVTRLEALKSIIASKGVKTASATVEEMFKDTGKLLDEDKKVIFLGTRGLPTLDGYALINGYGDGTFRPSNTLTRAEAVALISKCRKVKSADFEPPFMPPKVYTLPAIPSAKIAAEPTAKKTAAPPKEEGRFFLVVLSSLSYDEAIETARKLKSKGLSPAVVHEKTEPAPVFYVVLGVFTRLTHAKTEKARLESQGYTTSIWSPSTEGIPVSAVQPKLTEPKPKTIPTKALEIEITMPAIPPAPVSPDAKSLQPETAPSQYILIPK